MDETTPADERTSVWQVEYRVRLLEARLQEIQNWCIFLQMWVMLLLVPGLVCMIALFFKAL